MVERTPLKYITGQYLGRELSQQSKPEDPKKPRKEVDLIVKERLKLSTIKRGNPLISVTYEFPSMECIEGIDSILANYISS